MLKEKDMVSQVQILDEAVCASFWANTLGKGMNPSLHFSAIGKIVGQTGFFCWFRRKTIN